MQILSLRNINSILFAPFSVLFAICFMMNYTATRAKFHDVDGSAKKEEAGDHKSAHVREFLKPRRAAVMSFLVPDGV